MKRLLAAVVAAGALSVAPVAPTPTAHANVPQESVLMIGDSITWRTAPTLNNRYPGWHVDGKRGRPIKALGPRIKAYLRHNPAPDHFVMALGTNRSHDPDWTQRRLRVALNNLPKRTTVHLMLVVRTGQFQKWKDDTLRDYNRFSRNLAKNRDNFYVINWRKRVLNDPTLNKRTGVSSLLDDGTHPTGRDHRAKTQGPGVDTFVRMIEASLRKATR